MTHYNVLEQVARRGFCTITWAEYYELFPGHCLTKDEMDFKVELFKAGGKIYNPTGSSSHDKLHRFLEENHLYYEIVNELPTFHRGARTPHPDDVALNQDLPSGVWPTPRLKPGS